MRRKRGREMPRISHALPLCQFVSFNTCITYAFSISARLFPDDRYVPKIKAKPETSLVKDGELPPKGICPAYKGYLLEIFTCDLEQLLDDIDREMKGEPPILNIW